MTSYAGPIIDAHHHFWQPELGHNPWLLPEARIPFRYGDYEAIKRAYLPPDLLADASGFDIVGTVTMETEWDLDDPVGEMAYTQQVADRHGLPNAAVAHAVLSDPSVGDTLAQLAELPLVRGVRNKPGQAPGPAEAASYATLLDDRQWRAGYALLDRHQLSFDLQTAWWHADAAARLADDFPTTPMIINHAFLPALRTTDGITGWTEAIRLMSLRENVVIKISGIGVRDQPWTIEANRFVVEVIAEAFGPGRMMFASNFPVDSLTGSYAEIMGGFVELTRDWSATEQLAAFAGNAVRCYRLDPTILTRRTGDQDQTANHNEPR